MAKLESVAEECDEHPVVDISELIDLGDIYAFVGLVHGAPDQAEFRY